MGMTTDQWFKKPSHQKLRGFLTRSGGEQRPPFAYGATCEWQGHGIKARSIPLLTTSMFSSASPPAPAASAASPSMGWRGRSRCGWGCWGGVVDPCQGRRKDFLFHDFLPSLSLSRFRVRTSTTLLFSFSFFFLFFLLGLDAGTTQRCFEMPGRHAKNWASPPRCC